MDSGILSGIYAAFLSGMHPAIFSGIHFSILSGMNSGILSGLYSDIRSGISSGIVSGKCPDTYVDISFGILSGMVSGIGGGEHCDQELAVEEETALIKSKNPHLAGGDWIVSALQLLLGQASKASTSLLDILPVLGRWTQPLSTQHQSSKNRLLFRTCVFCEKLDQE